MRRYDSFFVCYGPDEAGAGGGDTGATGSDSGASEGATSPPGELSGSDIAAEFEAVGSEAGEQGDSTTGGEVAAEAPAVADQPSGEPSAKEQRRAQRDQARAQQLEIQRQTLEALARLTQQQQPAQPNEPAKPKFDVEKYNQLQREGKTVEALAMLNKYSLMQDQEFMKSALEPHLEPIRQLEAQRKQQAHQQAMQSHHAATQAKYPDFKPGSPQYEMTQKFVDANPWIATLAQARPDINAVEYAYRLATYENMAQQLRARDAKLVDKRASAVTVKTGTGNKVASKTKNPARDAANDLRDKGVDVPESWERDMQAALNRY